MILKDIDNDEMVHSLIHELVIAEGCGNHYKGNLSLCRYINLERIVVKKNSLKYLNSLRISYNPVLKSIETEGSEVETIGKSVFLYVKSVVIESAIFDD